MRHVRLRATGSLVATALIFAMCMIAGSSAAALDCIDYTQLPRQIGNDVFGSTHGTIALSGDRAFVAGSGDLVGLWVEDVSDPEHPLSLGFTTLPETPRALALYGDLVYAACVGAGVQILQVAPSGEPTLVGTVPSQDETTDLVVDGGVLWIADRMGSFAAFDLTDPVAPSEIARGDVVEVNKVRVDGSLLVVLFSVAGSTDLQTWDVSDPAAPVLLGSKHAGVSCTPGDCAGISDVALSAGYAYAVLTDRRCLTPYCYDVWTYVDLQVWDLTNPSDPLRLARHPLAKRQVGTGIAIAGSLAYVSSTSGSLFVIDVSEPYAPRELNGVMTSAGGYDVAVRSGPSGDLAFVVESGLTVYDMTGAEQPDLIGGSEVDPVVLDVVRVGDIAYTLGSNFGGIWTGAFTVRGWDVSAPALPAELFSSSGTGYGYAYEGDLEVASGDLYLSGLDGDAGFALLRSEILPSGAPGPPVTVWPRSFDAEPVGSHLLVAAGMNGLQVLRTFPDALPTLVGEEGTMATRVAADGDLAVVLQGSFIPGRDIHTLDISDLTAPVVLGTLGLSYPFRWIDLQGDLVALGGANMGVPLDIRLIDVSDPSAPSVVASFDLPGESLDGQLLGTTLWVVLDGGGCAAIDVSDPEFPVLRGMIPTDPARAVLPASDFVLACEGGRLSGMPPDCLATAGVGIVPERLTGTGLRVAPNPFIQTTTIFYDVPRTRHGYVDVFDMRGRLVRRLLDGAPGSGDLVWDGRDGTGRFVSPGVYFLRLDDGVRRVTTKVTLVR